MLSNAVKKVILTRDLNGPLALLSDFMYSTSRFYCHVMQPTKQAHYSFCSRHSILKVQDMKVKQKIKKINCPIILKVVGATSAYVCLHIAVYGTKSGLQYYKTHWWHWRQGGLVGPSSSSCNSSVVLMQWVTPHFIIPLS